MATTEELMAEYGVAWFGFDETSGNVYDKLGSDYVGTVTGATRVSGWNGEGKAMSFNGSNSFVAFNKGLDMNEFSIRLKIKAVKGRIFYCVTNSTSTKNGLGIFINDNGNLHVASYNNSSNPTASLDTGYKWKSQIWEDVLVSLKDNTVSIYINEKKIFKAIMDIGHLRENIFLGKWNLSGYEGFLNGQIDDLQIYSKALTPQDFTQNHIAIKTSDNKNLVLPNREGRVKEIPSLEVTDLIKQGYTWREIDNAIDSTGFDLTQPTTEYEKVSKSNVALGNGKMFTIPIEDFKTVKIDNNY